jgi:RNA recognition motif-containing protein
MTVFVANLPYSITDEDLAECFGQYGAVQRATVVLDRNTGRSKGFGFVEMPNDAEAQAAIAELACSKWLGRTIGVREAIERQEKPKKNL